MTATATYMRLRDGGWGLRIVGDTSPGMIVTVTRRDGQTRTETVGRILWQRDGVWGCTIASAEEIARFEARPRTVFDEQMHVTKPAAPVPPDDGTIPFDGPYTSSRRDQEVPENPKPILEPAIDLF